MKFSIKDFFRKCDRIWSHVLMKSLMENFIFFRKVIMESPRITVKSLGCLNFRSVKSSLLLFFFCYNALLFCGKSLFGTSDFYHCWESPCFRIMVFNLSWGTIVLLSISWTQSAITCSKLTIETLEQGVKYVQS